MSTDMNFDYNYFYQSDEQAFGYFFIGQKKINTETIFCEKIHKWSIDDERHFIPVNPLTLNNILKSGRVEKMFLTVTEPIFICICFYKSTKKQKEFLKMSFENFISFQEIYCKSYDFFPEKTVDWSNNGF